MKRSLAETRNPRSPSMRITRASGFAAGPTWSDSIVGVGVSVAEASHAVSVVTGPTDLRVGATGIFSERTVKVAVSRQGFCSGMPRLAFLSVGRESSRPEEPHFSSLANVSHRLCSPRV
jgi:hypothetical protein